MKNVFLGIGHGGVDSGAVGIGGVKEKDLNLSIGLACNEVLINHGVNVLMSRTADENDTLDDRVNKCNAFLGKDGLAVDIHNNAGGGNGAEAFYHYRGGTSKTLADNVLCEIVSIGQNSRGAKIKQNSEGRDYYGFIRQTVAPAIIIECAFVDNAEDIKIIDTEDKRRKMGEAIAKGILKTLGISYKQPEQNTAQKTIYCVRVGTYSDKAEAEKIQGALNTLGIKATVNEVK